MTLDEKFMQRCIQLAAGGEGHTAPNPLVGSVIVHEGRIIGEGFHRQFGQAHAEREALANVREKELLSRSTLYVNLEPCAHHGKTPPCVDAILEAGIPRVVIACRDPFKEVNGRGIERLRTAGVEVVTGILENEGYVLNRRFFTFHTRKRPYVVLKWAETADGFMDRERHGDKGQHRISAPETQKLVHLWRSREAAILVGKNTVMTDNPALTVRAVAGKNPVRLILDSKLEIPPSAAVFSAEAPTIVFNSVRSDARDNVLFVRGSDTNLMGLALNWMYESNILSVLVEGGRHTLMQFIQAGLWDEARIIRSDTTLGKGLRAPEMGLPAERTESYGRDTIHYCFNA